MKKTNKVILCTILAIIAIILINGKCFAGGSGEKHSITSDYGTQICKDEDGNDIISPIHLEYVFDKTSAYEDGSFYVSFDTNNKVVHTARVKITLLERYIDEEGNVYRFSHKKPVVSANEIGNIELTLGEEANIFYFEMPNEDIRINVDYSIDYDIRLEDLKVGDSIKWGTKILVNLENYDFDVDEGSWARTTHPGVTEYVAEVTRNTMWDTADNSIGFVVDKIVDNTTFKAFKIKSVFPIVVSKDVEGLIVKQNGNTIEKTFHKGNLYEGYLYSACTGDEIEIIMPLDYTDNEGIKNKYKSSNFMKEISHDFSVGESELETTKTENENSLNFKFTMPINGALITPEYEKIILETPKNDDTTETPEKDNTVEKSEKDDTIAKTEMPNTGKSFVIIVSTIIVIALGIYCFKKNKDLKEI